MKKLKLKVNGMHCMGCANKIQNGLNGLDKILESKVDQSFTSVEIELHDSKVSMGQIKQKITDLGFTVESIELE